MAALQPDFDTRQPFTRAAAVAAGIDPRLLRGSRFRRVFRGVYVDAAVPETPLLRGQAALALFRRVPAFASHATAARIHGVPLPVLPEEHISVFRAADRRMHAGIRVHVARSAALIDVGDVRVSLEHPAASPVGLLSRSRPRPRTSAYDSCGAASRRGWGQAGRHG